jgi:flagellum-specific peptidoglycan hydrolase FlgJ
LCDKNAAIDGQACSASAVVIPMLIRARPSGTDAWHKEGALVQYEVSRNTVYASLFQSVRNFIESILGRAQTASAHKRVASRMHNQVASK